MNLENLSALELGNLVNRKIISPVEVIDYFEQRINKRNPSINAFTYLNFEEAREVAKLKEELLMRGEKLGPFTGVPIGLKDFLPTKEGWPATHGGVRSLHTIDDVDSEFYKAARKLGCIAVGKTNAPSFGFRGLTDNYEFGPTSTPFNIDYNSAGSSGGSASAVSDGLVAISEGGDAGGSIRLPAAWCGCFGFKPSAGLVPSVCRPDAWTATHPYCCGGPLTRNVNDAAMIMSAMQGYNPSDPISVPLARKDFVKYSDLGYAKDLQVAFTWDFGIFPKPDKEIVKLTEETLQNLRKHGIEVDEVSMEMDYDLDDCETAWLRGISIDTGIDLELWKKNGYDLEKDHRNDVPDIFLEWSKKAFESNMMDYRRFHDIRTNILDSHLKVFEDYDIILAPVTGCLPVKNAEYEGQTKGPSRIGDVFVDPYIGFAYTYLENMTGNPAASVPIGLASNSLPVGLQIVGKRYFDEDVFALAYFLEAIQPWNYDVAFNREVKLDL